MRAPPAIGINGSDEKHPGQRLTRWHVLTVVLLFLGYFGYYFCRSDYSVALPLIIAEEARKGTPVHIAQIRLGTIASLGVLAYAIGKFPSGGLADRFGGRRNFLGGMFGSVLFTLLFIAGGGFPLFTLAWLGNRLVQSLGWAGLVKVTSRWFSYTTYGSVMGVLSLSYLFGDAGARGIMSLLLAHGVGWRGLFAAGAGLVSLLFLGNLLFLRETPESYHLPAPAANPLNLFSDAPVAAGRQGMAGIFRVLLSSYAFWLVCGLSLGTTLLRETFNLWMPTYFTQVAGMTSAQAASGSALFPFFGGVSVLLAGFLSDSLGPEGRSRILLGGICLSVLALLGLAAVPAHGPRILPLALVAAVAFCLLGPYSYLAGAMSLDFGGREGSATASGLVDGFGYLAGVLSGNGMAHLAVSYGWQTMFIVLAGVAVLTSVVAALALWQQHRRARGRLAASRGRAMTAKAADMLVDGLRFTPDELVLEWQNQTFTVYRAQWLRDNDPAHRDPRNGQRLISLIDLPEEPNIQAVEQSPPGHVTVHWQDGARSIFSLLWLRAIDRERKAKARPMRMPWLGQPASSFAWCDYAAWMTEPAARADWLERAARDGMAFLRQVPIEDRALLAVAAQIGHVRETSDGRVFDVRSVAQPNDLSYTTLRLRVHTDGPYRDPVPGLQMLHCLTAAGEGGESLFVDGLAAAERLRTRDPEDFATLSQTLIRFRFQDAAVDLCAERTMIEIDPQGQFRAIYYNDRSIAPLFLAPPLLKKYYAAYRRLGTLLQEPARYVTYLLQPGDLVLFDNTRILHGRTAFSAGEHDAPGANRHLQGCYIDPDGFYSTLSILSRKG